MTLRWFPTTAVLLILSSATAGAERRAVVAVGTCADGKTVEATRQVREALGQTVLGYQFLSEEKTAELLGGLPGSLSEAQGLLDSARDDVFRSENKNFGRAEEKLRRALTVLDAALPSPERWQLFAQTSAVLSFVLWSTAENRPELLRAAEAPLYPVLAIDSEVALDPDHWMLPSWTRSFIGDPMNRKEAGTVRHRLRTLPRGTLEITSRAEGLPVAINGRPIGTTPLKLRLAIGTYQVEGVFPDRRGLSRQVVLTADSSERVVLDPYFDGAVHQTKGPCLVTPEARAERIAMLARLGRVLNVSSVVGVRLEEHAPGERFYVAAVVETDSGQERHEAKIPVSTTGPRAGALPQLAQFLLEGKEPTQPSMVLPVRPEPVVNPGEPEPVATGRMALRRPLAWSAVGVGAVGVLAAGYFGAQRQDVTQRMDATCPNGGCSDESSLAAYAQLKPERDAHTRWMAVTGLAGIGLAAAGGGLLVFGSDEGGTSVRGTAAPGSLIVHGRF